MTVTMITLKYENNLEFLKMQKILGEHSKISCSARFDKIDYLVYIIN